MLWLLLVVHVFLNKPQKQSPSITVQVLQTLYYVCGLSIGDIGSRYPQQRNLPKYMDQIASS